MPLRAVIASPEDLGALVRRIRTEHGLSQRQLAQRLGTSQRYLHELETGKPKRADARYFELLRQLGIRFTAEVDDA